MKVNYIKRWGKDGTVYNQTIKINKSMASEFNKYIKELKIISQNKHIFTDEDLQILDSLEFFDNKFIYGNLPTLNYFINFYVKNYIIQNAAKKDKDFERIKYRNTIFEID